MKFRFLFFFLSCVSLDRLSKFWIVSSENLPQVVIPHFLTLVDVRNTGIIFGLGANIPWFPLLIFFLSFLFSTILLFLFFFSSSFGEQIAISLMISGIVGNLLDRVFYGEVVDFIDVMIPFSISFGYPLHWPAFNFADSYLCLGVILFYSSLLRKPSV